MNVAQNITFGLEMHGVAKDVRNQKLAEVASMLQIDHLLDRKPGALSGGQRQRVAMGRALVRDPDVFLFDEPLSNLDAKLRVDMRTEIKKLHQRLGRTIVYVTHDQIEALTLSTRIAVMFDGYVQQLGTPKQIYDEPANVFVATFMGSPAMNVLPASITVKKAGTATLTLQSHDKPITIISRYAPLAAWDGKDVLFGIRPEAMTDIDGVDRQAQHVEKIQAMVEVTESARVGYVCDHAIRRQRRYGSCACRC